MPRIPSPINWLRQRNHPDDLLMTYSESHSIPSDNPRQKFREEIEYSQIMRPDAVKDFLSNLVDVWLDSLELKMVKIGSREVDAVETVERLVPQWNNEAVAIHFKGLDPNSSDDDAGFTLGILMPDADLEEVRNDILETIDEHLTPPIQLNYIVMYPYTAKAGKILFRPINPLNLDEMFGLE